MFCRRCGNVVAEGVRFCHHCGQPLAVPPGGVSSGSPGPAGSPALAARWLPPPGPMSVGPVGEYFLAPDEYRSPADAAAMRSLQSAGELNRLVQTFIGKYGKPWLESTFLGNGLRVGPSQLPLLYRLAAELGDTLCLTRLPDIYAVNLYNTPLAIARSTRSATIGTDTEAFVVVDVRLLGRLTDPRLTMEELRRDPVCFLLASELSHVALGHALWLGIALWLSLRGPTGLAGLISRPLIMPLIYWARQAVLSADRGVVLATGQYEAYRSSLIGQLVAHPRLVPLVNVEAYLRQMDGHDDAMGRFFEGVSSTYPYVSRRLASLDAFVQDPAYGVLRGRVEGFVRSQGGE